MGYLVLLFISTVSLASPDPSACEYFMREGSSGPAFHELVTSSSPESQRFFNLLKKGLTDRYESLPEVLEAVELMTVNPPDEGMVLNFSFDWSDALWRVKRYREKGILIYDVSTVQLKHQDTLMAYKSKGKSLNGGFSKVLVTLNQAIREDLLKNPDIQRIRVIASQVVNAPLVTTLTNIGYVLQRRPQSKPMLRMDFDMMGDGDLSRFPSNEIDGHDLIWYLQRLPVASSL